MKLWFKIFLLNSIIILTLVLLIGIGINFGIKTALKNEIIRQGELIAKNVANASLEYILLDDHYKTKRIVDEIKKEEANIEYIYIINQKGEVFVHTFGDNYPVDIKQWNTLENKKISTQLLNTEKGLIRDVGVKIFNALPLEVHIGLKETMITEPFIKLRNYIILVTSIILIFGAILFFVLSQYVIIQPLKNLVNFANELAKGNFGKKINLKSNDEIGWLSETFNFLSEELKIYNQKMEDYYRQMLNSEKLTSLGRLSASLAHEIRNPLTSIRTLFQTFKNNPENMTQEDMEVAITAVDQMNELVTKFLAFARTDGVFNSEIYINSIIKNVLKLLKFLIKSKNINIELNLTKIPPIKCDKGLLQQAILNLIMNAIESMNINGSLSISTNILDNNVVINIKDTGCGIPEEIKDKIFDPFFTTKENGTGLGLSIVYNIIKIHKGDIVFNSDDKGTTFIIKLPMGEI
jgi:signal transduction histidine kinase